MIKIEETTENNFLIEISPNYSLRGWNRVIFLGSLAFICLSIGVFFFIMGAGLILPFAWLEVILVLTCFYISFRWSQQKEVVYISNEKIKLCAQKILDKNLKLNLESLTSFMTKNVRNISAPNSAYEQINKLFLLLYLLFVYFWSLCSFAYLLLDWKI